MDATYYAIHQQAGKRERELGSKFGELVDVGFKVHLPDGSWRRFSTFNLRHEGIVEQKDLALEMIKNELGTDLSINFT